MTGSLAEQTGDVATAVAHAARLMRSRPDLAGEQAREILASIPGHPQALHLLGAAARARGDAAGARDILAPLAATQPNAADTHYELGLALATLQEHEGAARALRRAGELKPRRAATWLALADQLTILGDGDGADGAYAQSIRAGANDPELLQAASALCDNRLAVAERLLRDRLKASPTDVAAIRMLAEVGARLGRYEDAEHLLERCLELAPSFSGARHNLAIVLHRQGKSEAALAHVDALLACDRDNPGLRTLKAAALARIGDYGAAISLYEDILATHDRNPKAWLSYGHALKTAGRFDDSVASYRKAISLNATFGEAYWSLANLKTFQFTAADKAAMSAALSRDDLADTDRLHFEFAMGKAAEDDAQHEAAFAHYARANALRRTQIAYDAEETSAHVERAKALFTESFFRERAGFGVPEADPIFIVGLPRAGSTLLEQILSSHSAIEGTMELPDISAIVKTLAGQRRKGEPPRYPDVLRELSVDEVRDLGARYLATTRVQRRTNRPYFIDKMPNNFLHTGLIRLILPNAKIIDARRHPLGNCYAAFKQHFARGQNFTYSLDDVGRYYRDYVGLMAHFDAVIPGRIHRVIYEEMIANTEAEVRRLLSFCGLPFEPACLAFHQNDRAVRTASSEQVRRPIYGEAVDHWRNYETELAPLTDILGAEIQAHPHPPRRGV